MRLRELKIKNFGCIGENELIIKIDTIVVLIGSNNVGKTTVLEAYKAFETGGSLAIDSFHQYDKNNSIEITGKFSDITEDDKILIGEKWIHDDTEYGDCIKYRYIWSIPNVKGQKQSYNKENNEWTDGGMGGWDSKIQSCIPTSLIINPLDNPETLEKTIIEILSSAVKESSKISGSKINALTDSLNNIAEEIQTEIKGELDEATSGIELNIRSIFPHTTVSLKPQAGNFAPEKIIASGSHLRIGNEGSSKDYPLSTQGAGLQRAFLWSAIQALAEKGRLKKGKGIVNNEKPKILLIEEPESFLHPPAIREAREALYDIAKADGWQVMITTHSPIFIDVSKEHTTIIRVDKTETGETKKFSTEIAEFNVEERERLKMIRNCNPEVNEFFFADKILLVEGETEHSIFNELKKDNSVHIVNCFGKGNIPTFQKILNHFGVTYTALHDTDCPKAKRVVDKKTKWYKNSVWTINEKILEESLKNEGNIILASVPDLEINYFGKLQKGDKPYQAIKKIKDKEFQKTDAYSKLVQIANVEVEYFKKNKLNIESKEQYKEQVEEYVEKHGLTDEKWIFD